MFHLFCLLSVAFFMPLSVWLVSVFSIAMAVNWIIGFDYREKTEILAEQKELLFIPALFLLYILWLLNTSNFSQAITELKLKLPLLLFPLFAGAYGRFSTNRARMILLAFITGCSLAVVSGYAALAGFIHVTLRDSRDLSLFQPSIRLSILINLAVFASLYLAYNKETGPLILRLFLALAALLMGLFLFRLLSVTGIIILVLISLGSAVYFLTRPGKRKTGLLAALAAFVTLFIFMTGMSKAWRVLHTPEKPEINTVTEKTPSGHNYISLPEETQLERGYLVWNNVCEEEMRREWNSRSKMPYDSTDMAGNDLRVTLIRYISYLGMKKDSAAVVSLSSKDIRNIEAGFANPLYADIGNPLAKWYEVAWQIDRRMKGANPSGHSITQRLEFYKASFLIIRQNPWTGTGTGDVRKAFDLAYEFSDSPLTPEYRLMAHNQYLTFAITFGIPGMIIALFLMLSPAIIARRRMTYLFIVFLAIIFISMFNDDTFESAIGTSFFSYFYTLFLLIE
jgi:hypothetical protein